MIRVLCLLALVSSGCALRRVPLDVLSKLPYEAKIELLEAENDLAVAVDRLDEAKAEVSRAAQQIRRAKDRERAADFELGNAKDADSKEIARLALTEADRRVTWLRARQELNVSEESLATRGLRCAEARYELARLTAARKAKLEGSERLEPADFEGQLKQCEGEYAQLKEGLRKSGQEAEAIKAKWEEARAALAKKTFDARASPFVE